MARTKDTARKSTGRKAPLTSQSAIESSSPLTVRVKKPHKYRPGTIALREIAMAQNVSKKGKKGSEHLIPKLQFQRICSELCQGNPRFDPATLPVLQETVEAYIKNILTDIQLVAIHAKRVTIMPKDVQLARRLRGV